LDIFIALEFIIINSTLSILRLSHRDADATFEFFARCNGMLLGWSSLHRAVSRLIIK